MEGFGSLKPYGGAITALSSYSDVEFYTWKFKLRNTENDSLRNSALNEMINFTVTLDSSTVDSIHVFVQINFF